MDGIRDDGKHVSAGVFGANLRHAENSQGGEFNVHLHCDDSGEDFVCC